MLIKKCNLIDMENIFKEIRDIRLKAGKIVEVGENLIPEPEEEILDADKVLKKYNAKVIDIIEYQLPLKENFTRNLIIIKI